MDALDSSEKMNWQIDIMPRRTREALGYLAKQTWLKRTGWYLAGGTAIALQAGHRTSQDLDFFNPKKFSTPALLKKFPKKIWEAHISREGTVYGKLLNAKVSFIYYPFFVPKQKFLHYGSVRVMDERDIAVMKIVAISQRGTKRDFVDLYWYCQNREPLLQILERLPAQYPLTKHNYQHIVKALTYFDDAEADPEPVVFFPASWKTVKSFFRAEAAQAAKDFLGL